MSIRISDDVMVKDQHRTAGLSRQLDGGSVKTPYQGISRNATEQAF